MDSSKSYTFIYIMAVHIKFSTVGDRTRALSGHFYAREMKDDTSKGAKAP